MDFLARHGTLYGITDPRSLYVIRVAGDASGHHVFFGQRRNRVTVLGAQLAVHMASGQITATNGIYLNDTPVSTTPVVSSQAAAARAKRTAGAGSRVLGVPRLVVFDPALLMTSEELAVRHVAARARLAWRVTAA
jgi:Zn-dependent metalloprotease